jgi:hypothetical protein
MLQDFTHTTGTVLIRLKRRQTSKELLHRQSHSHDQSRVLTDHEGTPCETSIHGAHHVNEAGKGSHHIWISSHELQGLNYHTKDLLLSVLAHLWDDNQTQLPEVQKTLYVATYEARKEYEATCTPLPQPSVLPSPRNYHACLRTARRLQASPT